MDHRRFAARAGVVAMYTLGGGAYIAGAQTNYGSVRGVVKDAQGASVTGAQVTLTSERTHTTRDVDTNGGGIYFLDLSTPGNTLSALLVPDSRSLKRV
jgi:hypothetical protein